MITNINVFQHIFLNTFDNGAFAHLVQRPGPYVHSGDIESCGNPVVRMLMSELATTEDCTSKAIADARIGKIVLQLNEAREAIRAIAMPEDYVFDLRSDDPATRTSALNKRIMAFSTFGARADKGSGIYNNIEGGLPDTVKNVNDTDGMGEVVGKQE